MGTIRFVGRVRWSVELKFRPALVFVQLSWWMPVKLGFPGIASRNQFEFEVDTGSDSPLPKFERLSNPLFFFCC
jgi:hypothetical protein